MHMNALRCASWLTALIMIAGFHIIFGAYGFWLPNDPRGSWSEFVGSWNLFRYGGRATKTTETRSVAYRAHNHALRIGTKQALVRPAVQFTGLQARSVALGIGDYCACTVTKVLACAVLPDHVHLVTGPLRLKVDQFVIQLKGAATRKLIDDGVHPFANRCEPGARPPKCFARGEWKVFLDLDDVPHAVNYVELNPQKEGKPRQHWSFVVPYR